MIDTEIPSRLSVQHREGREGGISNRWNKKRGIEPIHDFASTE